MNEGKKMIPVVYPELREDVNNNEMASCNNANAV